ncbi:MAG: hypothetical protein M1834_007840 [Cirrosporium novae-zelandiae]|nr:MAG: hypothetical protein M1834_007840 [Cirrosporium novae-zelandiae]
MSTPSPLKLTTLPGFCLHVEVKIAPENIEKFLAHFKICVEACRAEPELISFEVFQFQDEPGKFRLDILEYYSDILILATNCVGEFDEAIKSHAQCALYYPPLNKGHALEIWKKSLDRLDRQHALANWDNLKESTDSKNKSSPWLEYKYFKKVATASAYFEMNLTEIWFSDCTRAKTSELHRGDPTNEMTGYSSQKERSSKAKGGLVAKIPWPKVTSEDLDTETCLPTSEPDSEPVKKRNNEHKERHRKRKDDREKGKASKECKLKDKSLQKKSSR